MAHGPKHTHTHTHTHMYIHTPLIMPKWNGKMKMKQNKSNINNIFNESVASTDFCIGVVGIGVASKVGRLRVFPGLWGDGEKHGHVHSKYSC